MSLQLWVLTLCDSSQLFARQDIAACAPYASKMMSWCNTGDVYCDKGDVRAVHSSYFRLYTEDVTNFVVSMYEKSGGSTAPSGSATGGSPSATTSASGTGAPSASVKPNAAPPSRVAYPLGFTVALLWAMSYWA